MAEKNSLIFIIEDEESISDLIKLYLSKNNIDSEQYFNAEDAFEQLLNGKNPSLILLDLNLPGMSGFDFLEKLSSTPEIPRQNITILSARDTDEDIIKGLDIGANEFITKPFSPGVLIARIKANLRRNSQYQEESISFGDYTLLLKSCVLKKGDEKIALSSKEYQVLEFLVKHAGESLSPEKIYTDVWKVDYGDITAVSVYIRRLRIKLDGNSENSKYIKTNFGEGYIFNKNMIK